jgi:hypothetical protein
MNKCKCCKLNKVEETDYNLCFNCYVSITNVNYNALQNYKNGA